MDIKEIRELIQKEQKKEPPILTARELAILAFRFGLTDSQTHTLEEVGKLFGVTRERIRQIEAKAFEKLRQINKGRKKIIK